MVTAKKLRAIRVVRKPIAKAITGPLITWSRLVFWPEVSLQFTRYIETVANNRKRKTMVNNPMVPLLSRMISDLEITCMG